MNDRIRYEYSAGFIFTTESLIFLVKAQHSFKLQLADVLTSPRNATKSLRDVRNPLEPDAAVDVLAKLVKDLIVGQFNDSQLQNLRDFWRLSLVAPSLRLQFSKVPLEQVLAVRRI